MNPAKLLPATLLPARLLVVSVVLVGCRGSADRAAPHATSVPAAATKAALPFENEIAAFERADRATPMPDNAIVFYGSSSLRKWTTLQADFPGLPVVNRGFGGSRADEAIAYLDRVIFTHRPATIVLYEGDNDIASGRTPERVIADLHTLVSKLHAKLPQTRLIYLSIKYSASRAALRPKMEQVNAAMKAMADSDPKLDYVDVATPLLDASGQPRPELFEADKLHINHDGYALWTKVLTPVLK